MKFRTCDVAGAWVVDPAPHADARGRFMRAWCSREFAEQGIVFVPVQANMGYSVQRGTIRGLHWQGGPGPAARHRRRPRRAPVAGVVARGPPPPPPPPP